MSKTPNNIKKKKLESIALKLLNTNLERKNKNMKFITRNKTKELNKEVNDINRDTQKSILTLANYEAKINHSKNFSNHNIKQVNSYSVNNNNKNNKSNGFKSIKEEEKEKIRKKSQIPKSKKEIVPKIKGLENVAKNNIDKLNNNNNNNNNNN